MSDEDVRNTNGLVALTEYQKVGWKLKNWDNKNYKRQT